MNTWLVFVTFSSFVIFFAETRPTASTDKFSYSLVRVFPKSRLHVSQLQELRRRRKVLQVAFWRPADRPYRHVDIWIHGAGEKMLSALSERNIAYKMHLTNLTHSAELRNVSMKNIDTYDRIYHSFEEIYSEMKRISLAYGDVAKLISIGKSYENRDLYAMQFNKSSSQKKPLMVINCGIHGREWLAVASCMCLMRKMAFEEKYDRSMQFIIRNFEVIIIPVLNPDGYVFSKTKNRYWRKSRSKTRNKRCPGVDLNRNFNFKWGGRGASQDICEETFSGDRPFSERETLALARYLYSRRYDLKAFLDVHTFGQLLMYPWGYTRQDSFHWKTQRGLLRRISRLIEWTTASRYEFGPASSVLYETSGDSTDWVYGYLGVTHSYGIELRPKMVGRASLQGFIQPVHQIVPTSGELFIMIREILRQVHQEPNMKRN